MNTILNTNLIAFSMRNSKLNSFIDDAIKLLKLGLGMPNAFKKVFKSKHSSPPRSLAQITNILAQFLKPEAGNCREKTAFNVFKLTVV